MSMSSDVKIGNGQTVVGAAGTRVVLATGPNNRVLSVTIKALSTNGANLIYVGDSAVAAGNGYELAANASIDIYTDDPEHLIDLTSIWLDASANDMGVSFIYMRQ